MKSKILPLLILSLLLLTPESFALTPEESRIGPSGDLGIEPQLLYQGALLLELIEIAETEIETAASEAYAEGYKAAMLRHAPNAAMHKAESEFLRMELEKERKMNRLFWPAIGISSGVSFVLGFLFNSLIAR